MATHKLAKMERDWQTLRERVTALIEKAKHKSTIMFGAVEGDRTSAGKLYDHGKDIGMRDAYQTILDLMKELEAE